MLGQCSFQKSSVMFLPYGPEFFRRAGGGVLHGVFIGRHYDLSKLVELRNVFLLLVADVLLHGLFYADLGRFTLNDSERDTVDKQHNIRPGIVKLVPAVYCKLFGDMEQVVLRMFPVNVSSFRCRRKLRNNCSSKFYTLRCYSYYQRTIASIGASSGNTYEAI